MGNPLIPADGVWALSANKLNIFNSCPFHYYLYATHQDGAIEDTKYITCGQAVHQYMEDKNNGCAQSPEYYFDKWEVPEEMRERFNTCIENAEEFLHLKGTSELTETTMFDTPKGRHINLSSRIDLQCEDADVEGANPKLVIDWKTGRTLSKPEYLLQMQVYRFVRNFEYDAMLVSLLTGEKKVISKSPKNYIPNMCDKLIDAVENNEFPRVYNSVTCPRFCPYYEKFCSEEHKYDLIVPKMNWDSEKGVWTE